MATGCTVAAPPSSIARCAAPTSAERNGSTLLPSLDVPSAKSTMMSPFESRPATSSACAPVAWRRSRSTKTVRCVLARKPTTGQPATSFLAMKETGATPARIGMSSQEVWLERRSSGRSSAGAPVTVTRMPIRKQTKRCQSCATFIVERPPSVTRDEVERQQHGERERGEQRPCRRSGCGRASSARLSAPCRAARRRARAGGRPACSRARARSAPGCFSISSLRNSMTVPERRSIRWSWCSSGSVS